MVNSQQSVFLKCQSKVLVFFLLILQSPQSPFWHCLWIQSILSVLTILIIPKVAAHINTQGLAHTCTQTRVRTGTHAQTHTRTQTRPRSYSRSSFLCLYSSSGKNPAAPLLFFCPTTHPLTHSASLVLPRPWSQGDFPFPSDPFLCMTQSWNLSATPAVSPKGGCLENWTRPQCCCHSRPPSRQHQEHRNRIYLQASLRHCKLSG